MRVSLLLLGAALGSSLVACAVPAPEPETTTSSSATAVIVVERTTGPGDAVRGDAVIAKFVRVRQGSVDDAALRIAGIADDLPGVGSCSAPAEAGRESAPLGQARAVELLDVGQVTLSSQPTEGAAVQPLLPTGKSTLLLPRSMPDPAGVVSGVFYSSRSTDVFAPNTRVSLRSSGGADLADALAVTVSAPRDMTDVRIGSLATGLDVAWDATDADPHDLVYADVLSPAPRVVVRCTANDTGRLLVPGSAIAGIEEGQLAVHRLHREVFRSKGIEPGEVRFDVARVVTFRR